MAKPPYPDSTGDTPDAGVGPGRRSPPGMPRWVKMFGLITVIVLVLLFVIQHLPGLGGMGGHH
jgi:hypothetical protein